MANVMGDVPVGHINVVQVLIAALAAFTVGEVWYGIIFARRWTRLAGVDASGARRRRPLPLVLTFLLEAFSALMIAHNFARLGEPPFHIKMMIAIGFALAFVIPALGVTTLTQRRPGALFLIDAGHWLLAYAAMGLVFATN